MAASEPDEDALEITVDCGNKIISSKTNPVLAGIAKELEAYLDEHADD